MDNEPEIRGQAEQHGSSAGKPPLRKPATRRPVPAASPPATTPPPAAEFAFDASANSSSVSARLGKKVPPLPKPVLLGGGICCLVVILGMGLLFLAGGDTNVALRPIPDQQVAESDTLQLVVETDAPEGREPTWRFSLENAPEGARIDEKTGEISWTPTEKQGPGWYEPVVCLEALGSKKPLDKKTIRIVVDEVNQPPTIAPIEPMSVKAGQTLAFKVQAKDPDHPAERIGFRLGGEVPRTASMDARSGQFRWHATGARPGTVQRFTVRVGELTPGGLVGSREFSVRVTGVAPEPPVVASRPSPPKTDMADNRPSPRPSRPKPVAPPPVAPPPVVPKKDVPPPSPDESETALREFEQAIIDLHKDKKLFVGSEYGPLRKLYADRFARENKDAIEQGLEGDGKTLLGYFKDHPEIRDEFFTAIDPRADNIPAAVRLFAGLVAAFPERFPAYANLAIATAITWDGGSRTVYDYRHHAARAKAPMPKEELAAVENFQYLVEAEHFMQGRVRFLPWEFLIHVVNHKTPLAERKWSMGNYMQRRVMFGQCYKDVPYDMEMLETKNARAKLNGKPYTLGNIRQHGGVCAHQADFASRVGKSIGVPAEYVRGESAFGEHHAWVMWVELKNVSKTSIAFTLESFGRYRNDKYYVGQLRNPQTGKQLTDRQLELRLHTVGVNWRAKRQADMLMAAYPMLRDRMKMDVAEQLFFLNQVMQLSPGNEDAWRAVAKMSRDGTIGVEHNKTMRVTLDRLFNTFAMFPDFTWEIFDDLIAYLDISKQRAKLYGRLVMLYEQSGRPDLACEARLKYADFLIAEGRYEEVIEGLAFTIKKFPSEGRYVPRLLDKLEEVCTKAGGKQDQLLQFYKQFLPLIPQQRGSRASPYCIKMYKRAVARFREANQPRAVTMLESQLARLQAGSN